ncbi:TPA: hypothetical protein ACX6NV_000590 [Photobacterium damselae]
MAIGRIIIGNVIEKLYEFIDKRVDNKQEAEKIKGIIELFLISKDCIKLTKQTDLVITELKGNFLQRSWRPIVMIIFAIGVVMGKPELYEVLLRGLSGYVG